MPSSPVFALDPLPTEPSRPGAEVAGETGRSFSSQPLRASASPRELLPPSRCAGSRHPGSPSRRRTARTWAAAHAALVALLGVSPSVHAATPNALPFQGRVSVDSLPFSGTGHFRFALVEATDAVRWTSAPDTSPGDGQPGSQEKTHQS